jgi:hypothetical protein
MQRIAKPCKPGGSSRRSTTGLGARSCRVLHTRHELWSHRGRILFTDMATLVRPWPDRNRLGADGGTDQTQGLGTLNQHHPRTPRLVNRPALLTSIKRGGAASTARPMTPKRRTLRCNATLRGS